MWRAVVAIVLVTSISSRLDAQNLDSSWVWCEPRNPLTYFVEVSAAAWRADIGRAAAAWSNGTAWNFVDAQTADAARISIRTEQVDAIMQALRNETHHRGDFRVTQWGYIEISGLRKPCAEKAEIRYWLDRANPPVNRQNTAMHEFGHALGLKDTDSRDDIMYRSEQNLVRLSATDIRLAEASEPRSNLNQLHRLVPPAEDTFLAFERAEALIPAGALERPVVFGIRPLSVSSLGPVIDLSFERIVAAAQIGPEWELAEDVPSARYVQKQLAVALPVQIVFLLVRDEAGGVRAAEGFESINTGKPPVDTSTLTLAHVDGEGRVTPLATTIKQEGDSVRLSASVTHFGDFVVVANEARRAADVTWLWVVVGAGVIAVVVLLTLARRRRVRTRVVG